MEKEMIQLYIESVITPIEKTRNELSEKIQKRGVFATKFEKELLEKYNQLLIEKYNKLEELIFKNNK